VLCTAKSTQSHCVLAQLVGDQGDAKGSNMPYGATAACCVLQRMGQVQGVPVRGTVPLSSQVS